VIRRLFELAGLRDRAVNDARLIAAQRSKIAELRRELAESRQHQLRLTVHGHQLERLVCALRARNDQLEALHKDQKGTT
jgi:hypothetical protein